MTAATASVSALMRRKDDDDPRAQPEVHGSGLADAIAGAAHGEDQARLLGHRLELLAQVPDVHVDRARVAVGAVAPDRAQRSWRLWTRLGSAISACSSSNSENVSADRVAAARDLAQPRIQRDGADRQLAPPRGRRRPRDAAPRGCGCAAPPDGTA